MKEQNIKVLVFEPGYKPYVKEIPNTLEAKQQIVGGPIAPINWFDDVMLIVNDDRWLFKGNPANFFIKNEDGRVIDIVYGNAFFCCGAGEEFGSITNELIEKYSRMFTRLYGKIGRRSLYEICGEMLKDKESEEEK